MFMTDRAILLLSNDPARRRQWAEMLADPSASIYDQAADVGEGRRIDVIVTDRVLPGEALLALVHAAARDEIAVVAVGVRDAPAAEDQPEASLPADCTQRELALACSLLAEIVHLRRARRAGDHAQLALRALALTDPLTGIGNRRAWDEELAARGKDSRGRPLCIVVFDVDHFKRVNGECNHSAGDALLKTVAQQLVSNVRPGDHAMRLGGDEFGLILDGLPPADAPAVVERVRTSLVQPADESRPFDVTASAGFAAVQQVGEGDADPRFLYAAACGALRRAKSQGRNRTIGITQN
jgi:diguanylate cyclase (GGDEF)-like protein